MKVFNVYGYVILLAIVVVLTNLLVLTFSVEGWILALLLFILVAAYNAKKFVFYSDKVVVKSLIGLFSFTLRAGDGISVVIHDKVDALPAMGYISFKKSENRNILYKILVNDFFMFSHGISRKQKKEMIAFFQGTAFNLCCD